MARDDSDANQVKQYQLLQMTYETLILPHALAAIAVLLSLPAISQTLSCFALTMMLTLLPTSLGAEYECIEMQGFVNEDFNGQWLPQVMCEICQRGVFDI